MEMTDQGETGVEQTCEDRKRGPEQKLTPGLLRWDPHAFQKSAPSLHFRFTVTCVTISGLSIAATLHKTIPTFQGRRLRLGEGQ